MKVKIQHALGLLLVTFLVMAPTVAAIGNSAFIIAEDEPGFGEELIQKLFEEGAEVIFSNIDEEGVPSVIYGQLGIPSDSLNLDSEMFQQCIAMALVSTHGEFLEMILELVGGDMFGDDGDDEYSEGEFVLAQDGGGFDVNSILDMLGTEFNLLINVFVNVDQATSQSRMSQILNHMSVTYGFGFTELFTYRIDENTFPPEADIELPFDSIDLYIYQEIHTFGDAVDFLFNVMDTGGFLDAINPSVFSGARAAASGLLAIPDMGYLAELIESFEGEDTGDYEPSFILSEVYQTAQLPFNVSGSLAIAAAGYRGDQVVSSATTELRISELIGSTGTISPLSTGNSLILMQLPENANITSYSPSVEGQSFYENGSNMVIWNATALGDQSDYIISFEADDFPPLVKLERTFSVNSTTVGGSTHVTVTLTNEGTEAISNVHLNDSGIADYYDSISVSGTTEKTFTNVPGGGTVEITYTVSFSNEGGYNFPRANAEYGYDGKTFAKTTPRDVVEVRSDIGGFLSQGISDGWPYSALALGVVGLVGVYAIMGIVRGSKSSGVYEV